MIRKRKSMIRFCNLCVPNQKRLAMRTLLATVVLMSLFLPACVGDCSKCQKAIDHMCDKLPTTGCNPDLMENAVAGINEDCNTSNTSLYVGYMTEACIFNYDNKCANCELTNLSATVNFLFTFTSVFTVDTLELKLIQGGIAQMQTYEFPTQPSYDYDDLVREGMSFRFELYMVQGGVLLDTKEVDFTFDRPGNWGGQRVVDINFNMSSGTFFLVLQNW